MRFSRAIRIARAIQDLSQSQLASRAKCSVSTISLIESGDRSPSLLMLNKISKALGISFELLSILAQDKEYIDFMSSVDIESIGRRLLCFVYNLQ